MSLAFSAAIFFAAAKLPVYASASSINDAASKEAADGAAKGAPQYVQNFEPSLFS
jgi:hypothetical protein